MWDQADWISSEDLTLHTPSKSIVRNQAKSESNRRKEALFASYPVGCVPPHLLTKQLDQTKQPELEARQASKLEKGVKRRTLLSFVGKTTKEGGENALPSPRRASTITTRVSVAINDPRSATVGARRVTSLQKPSQEVFDEAETDPAFNSDVLPIGDHSHSSGGTAQASRESKTKRQSLTQQLRHKFSLVSATDPQHPIGSSHLQPCNVSGLLPIDEEVRTEERSKSTNKIPFSSLFSTVLHNVTGYGTRKNRTVKSRRFSTLMGLKS